jgi:hypothetical protein
VLGAVLVNLGKTWFTSVLPEWWLYALGAMFIFVTLFLPRGLMGLLPRRTGAVDAAVAAQEAAIVHETVAAQEAVE